MLTSGHGTPTNGYEQGRHGDPKQSLYFPIRSMLNQVEMETSLVKTERKDKA